MPIPEGNPVTIQDGSGTTSNQAVVTSAGALKVDGSTAGGGTVAIQGSQLLTITSTGNQSGVALSTQEISPAAANILDGNATADAATIITIPQNRIWVGSVTLSAAVVIAAGASPAVNALPNVTTTGASATPAAGAVVLGLAISLPANLAGSVTGDGANDVVTIWPVTVYAGATAAATLKLNFNSASAASATAVGYLR